MEYCIRILLALCLTLSSVGAAVWLIYLFAHAAMVVFPYALLVVLGSLATGALIAWRRSREK